MGKTIKTGFKRKKDKFNIFKIEKELSSELLSSLPQIVLTGDRSALLEGGVSIIEYNDSRVKIAFRSGSITFFGKDFSINTFLDNKIAFNGKISSIEFS